MAEIIIDTKFEYCALNNPKVNSEGEPKYSVCCLFQKGNKKLFEELNAAAIECAKAVYGTETPANFDWGIRDGDEKHPKTGKVKKKNPAFHDAHFINAKSKFQPIMVVGQDRKPFIGTEPNGMSGTVSLSLRAYNVNGNKGISWALDAVWIKKKGTSIPRNTDASVFDGMDGSDCDNFDTQSQKSAEDVFNDLLA